MKNNIFVDVSKSPALKWTPSIKIAQTDSTVKEGWLSSIAEIKLCTLIEGRGRGDYFKPTFHHHKSLATGDSI